MEAHSIKEVIRLSETWEWVDGYDNATYTDPKIFEVDQSTKQLQVIKDQPLVAGEDRSQMIRFEMDRYWDGVDISPKSIQIIYLAPNGYTDINSAVCVERNDTRLRFGWVVPGAALMEPGKLAFSIEIVSEDYILKSRATSMEVYNGLNGALIIEEPTEKAWYIELQQRCDFVLNQAVDAKDSAAGSASQAAASATGAANVKTAVDATKGLIDAALVSLTAALEQIGVNATDIATLTGRIDQALADYDATAETEIMDARVGHNGITYPTLGAAIRGQFDELRLYADTQGYICQSEST